MICQRTPDDGWPFKLISRSDIPPGQVWIICNGELQAVIDTANTAVEIATPPTARQEVEEYLPARVPGCDDPGCGCGTPAFTEPMEALRFLSGRFKHAGVGEAVARSYAQDIDQILRREQESSAGDVDAEQVLSCSSCLKPYSEFPLDVVLPNDQWRAINGKDGGVLCASCIVMLGSKLPGVTVAHLRFDRAYEQAKAEVDAIGWPTATLCRNDTGQYYWQTTLPVGDMPTGDYVLKLRDAAPKPAGCEAYAWGTPGGDVSRSRMWCCERTQAGQFPFPLYREPQVGGVAVTGALIERFKQAFHTSTAPTYDEQITDGLLAALAPGEKENSHD